SHTDTYTLSLHDALPIFMRNILGFFLLICLSCNQKKTELVWKASLPGIGSQSSPRTADLNGDGILDIVMGAGANEYQESAFGVRSEEHTSELQSRENLVC